MSPARSNVAVRQKQIGPAMALLAKEWVLLEKVAKQDWPERPKQ